MGAAHRCPCCRALACQRRSNTTRSRSRRSRWRGAAGVGAAGAGAGAGAGAAHSSRFQKRQRTCSPLSCPHAACRWCGVRWREMQPSSLDSMRAGSAFAVPCRGCSAAVSRSAPRPRTNPQLQAREPAPAPPITPPTPAPSPAAPPTRSAPRRPRRFPTTLRFQDSSSSGAAHLVLACVWAPRLAHTLRARGPLSLPPCPRPHRPIGAHPPATPSNSEGVCISLARRAGSPS